VSRFDCWQSVARDDTELSAGAVNGSASHSHPSTSSTAGVRSCCSSCDLALHDEHQLRRTDLLSRLLRQGQAGVGAEDGYRENTKSWAAVLRDFKDRGLNEPRLMIGHGTLGTWAALRDVFPAARKQTCWAHKIARVGRAAEALQPRAKGMLHEIMEALARRRAPGAGGRFRSEFDAKYPKAVANLDRDWAALTAFYDFPGEHWRHLRTANAIESSFATVKLRTRVTKGAGSKKAALAMAYKLLHAAQER
jgi:putative transposase